MIWINKNTEPKEWTIYRKTQGVKFQSNPELIESLLEEQGYICAYCMRRIPRKDFINGKQTQEDHRIEHILSQKNHNEKRLDYSNIVICCPGYSGDYHCDRSKGERDISFSPTDKNFIDTIRYSINGEISSTNIKFNNEIKDILNLNTNQLKRNRH